MDSFPPEILTKIFENFDIKHLNVISCVCSQWKNIASTVGTKRTRINQQMNSREVVPLCEFMGSSCPNVTVLKLSVEEINCSLLEILNRENSLASALVNLSFLTCLTLNCFIVDVSLPPTLKHININFGKISETRASMALTNIFEDCPCIERINFSYIYQNVSLPGTKAFFSRPHLKYFYLSSKYTSSEFLEIVVSVASSVDIGLELFMCNIDGIMCRALTLISNLKKLILNEVRNLDNFVDNMLKTYHEISSLADVTVVNCSTPLDAKFFHMCSINIPNLKIIRIKNTPVSSDQLLRYIETSENIKQVFLAIEVFSINKFISKLLVLTQKRSFDNICLCELPNLNGNTSKTHLLQSIRTHFPCKGCEFYSIANLTCKC